MVANYCWALRTDLFQKNVQIEKCRCEGLSNTKKCVLIKNSSPFMQLWKTDTNLTDVSYSIPGSKLIQLSSEKYRSGNFVLR